MILSDAEKKKKQRWYYLKNLEKNKSHSKKYYLDNKEKCIKYRKQYYWNNRDAQIAASTKWHKDNPEKCKIFAKRYYLSRKDTMNERRKERSLMWKKQSDTEQLSNMMEFTKSLLEEMR